MNRLKLILPNIIALSALAFVVPCEANPNEDKAAKTSVNVAWGDFNEYRDVRSGNEPEGIFHERVKKSFNKFFDDFSKNLDQGQSLSIEITDLDLAGNVTPTGTHQIRIMKDIGFPRMEFSYSLTDANGNVIKQGDAKIKDMNYLYHEKTWRRYKEGFYYEKRMFREWFEETLSNS